MPVVNFGLYANLGTKYMLDIAKDFIGKDDIVIIAHSPFNNTSCPLVTISTPDKLNIFAATSA